MPSEALLGCCQARWHLCCRVKTHTCQPGKQSTCQSRKTFLLCVHIRPTKAASIRRKAPTESNTECLYFVTHSHHAKQGGGE